ncbi:tyrosine-type recombinase/integrase [Candidatus Nitrotoga arctica]|uniref:Integrase n=1 Tax=Candidatus Nitrotoga arctica TaxID=453162 RepID=A0ABM8YVJ5_9PROT|nr:integrase arm-type DNA-binding domain-containing protein [Candidatus Nitrotoga arctica]CAG9931540.1 Integrase [Candidatus Nitrotoga arctica]
MKLSDAAARKAKPEAKAYKMADGGGMYLEVMPTGSKYWRLKYRFGGKEKRLAFGVYPDVSLAQARERRGDARKLLANDIDPGIVKQAQKATKLELAENSFEVIAREWFVRHTPNWKENHSSKIIARLEKDVFPWIGARPIAEIAAPALLATMRRIEARGALETAHRALACCGQIFRYAVSTGRAERDPTGDLRGSLPPVKRDKHFAAITEPKKVGELMRDIDGYQGSYIVKSAFKLSPLLFVRPGELRKMEWKDLNLDAAEWCYFITKTETQHIVPLARQAVEVLREIQPLTGRGKYVFHGERDHDRPMSDNAIRSALRRMGWANDEMTPHGFRAMASTILDNMGYKQEWLERQLAHEEPNKVKAAYKRDAWRMYLPERTAMMQAWADYLDKLKAGAVVIPLRA